MYILFQTVYTDATLACNGKFYHVHRLVLSTCSEYFNAIFNHTPCKNPVVVLKDVTCRDLEFLLDYMYAGEVNVRQIELPSLISAAEYLQIKGLAISDEKFASNSETNKLDISTVNDKTVEKNDKYDSAKNEVFENEKLIQETSNDGSFISQTSEKTNSSSSLFINKNSKSHISPEDDNISHLKLRDSFETIIKSEPGLDSPIYESTSIRGEPCTSHSENALPNTDESSSTYQFFANEAKFADPMLNVSNFF